MAVLLKIQHRHGSENEQLGTLYHCPIHWQACRLPSLSPTSHRQLGNVSEKYLRSCNLPKDYSFAPHRVLTTQRTSDLQAFLLPYSQGVMLGCYVELGNTLCGTAQSICYASMLTAV